MTQNVFQLCGTPRLDRRARDTSSMENDNLMLDESESFKLRQRGPNKSHLAKRIQRQAPALKSEFKKILLDLKQALKEVQIRLQSKHLKELPYVS